MLCISLLIVTLDNTVLNVVLPTLVRDLATRYSGRMTAALAPYHVPVPVLHAILGSVGGALEVAARVGGVEGAALVRAARSAFVSGMALGLATGAGVALAGGLVALLTLPRRRAR